MIVMVAFGQPGASIPPLMAAVEAISPGIDLAGQVMAGSAASQ